MISKYTAIRLTVFILSMLFSFTVLAEPVPTSGELQVNADAIENHTEADVAIAGDGSFIVTWQSTDDNVYFRRFDASGAPLSGDILVNQTLTSEHFDPSIGMDGSGNSVISWTTRSGTNLDIYARRYNNVGTPLGNEFLVNTTTAQAQGSSEIAVADNGRFVITWSGLGTGLDNADIMAQIYDASGNPVGSEFLVNSSGTTFRGRQTAPQIAIANSGEFFICWNSQNQDGALFGAYARRFASDGTPNSAEFLVNDETDGNEGCYDVAMDSSGNAILMYFRRPPSASNHILYAKRYDNAGNQVGSRFQITNDAPSNAQVELSDDGSFFVGWVSSANGLDVEGQAFTATNTADGNAFTLSQNTNQTQAHIRLAMNASGQIVSTWTSSHIRSGSPDVYTRTILLDAPEVTFETASANDVEGNTVNVNVNLTIGATVPYSSVTIPLIYSGTADGTDYTNAPARVTFTGLSANATFTETISIDLVDDGIAESAETIIIDLNPALPTVLGTISQHTINIDGQSANVVTTNPNDNNDVIVQTNGTSNDADVQIGSLEIFDPAISKIGFLTPGQTGIIGEQLEWIVTVSNTGNVVGNNVTITDTLIDALKIDRVDAPNATVNINGQTVSVTYATLEIGQTVQFSIFTTVLKGTTQTNTACVTADNQAVSECISTIAVSQLPATGETPFWRHLLVLSGASVLALMFLPIVKSLRRNT
ncbi:MAG: hypothetical protein AAFV98_05370 [Chloroflexota bacterium]